MKITLSRSSTTDAARMSRPLLGYLSTPSPETTTCVPSGDWIWTAIGGAAAPAGAVPVVHVVASGEHLTGIAAHYGTTAEAMASLA